VDPRGLEPLTSAMRGRGNSLLERSGACEIPANMLILYVDSFLNVSGDLLGLLHGCCTDVRAYIHTRSGMIVIRAAAWRPRMRPSF